MEFITQNGQKAVKITPASFADAINLKKAVMKCFLDAGLIKSLDTSSVETTQLAARIDSVLEALFTIETSDDFEKAVFECLKTCVYDDKHKITKELFDDKPDAREDYYEIVVKCCEVNLNPFFKSLVSEFKTQFSKIVNDFLK